MDYCYYTQLLSKCQTLEDNRRRTDSDFAVRAAGIDCSTNYEEVEGSQVGKRVVASVLCCCKPQACDVAADMSIHECR